MVDSTEMYRILALGYTVSSVLKYSTFFLIVNTNSHPFFQQLKTAALPDDTLCREEIHAARQSLPNKISS